ncbi:DUF58 domain-containing protein [Desulfonema limicola]|nr:DUF58 domain-containing protein [Desulfonema limicola]
MVFFGAAVSAIMGIDTGRTLCYQIFSFLSCLLLVSICVSFFFRPCLSVKRFLPEMATAGSPLRYRAAIKNLSKKKYNDLFFIEIQADPVPDFQTFLRIPEPGEEKRNFFDRAVKYYRWEWLISMKTMAKITPHSIPPVMPGEEAVIHCEIFPQKRGVLHLSGFFIARPDFFGLFYAMKKISLPQSVVILPRRCNLPQPELEGKRQYQSGGVSLSSSVGDSEEFVSLRDYRPGDPLKRIHWKSWAKTGRPVVKEYQGEFYVRHALILDTFEIHEYSTRFEEAVSAAASFACNMETRESLLDLMFVGTQAYCFTTGRSLGHLDNTLKILASARPCYDKPFKSLGALVMEKASALSSCICILLSWDDERKTLVKNLKSMGVSVVVFLFLESNKDKFIDYGPMADTPDRFFMLVEQETPG